MRATANCLLGVLVSGLLLGSAAEPVSGQPSEPVVRPSGPALRVAPVPNPPILSAPADNHVITAVSGIPSQIFTWDPPTSGPSVVFYRLTFEDADNPSAFSPSPIRIEATGGRVSTSRIIPPALAEARIRWSVRACNNDPTLTLIGAPPGNCGQPASRILAWSTTVQPPQLQRPAAGARVPPNSQFVWRTVSGANAYLFCISRPGVACPTTETSNNDTIVVRRVGNSASFAAPDTWRFRAAAMNWTAAACSAAGVCVYQQNVRPVTVAFSPPQLVSPANDAHAPPNSPFAWSSVVGANSYLFCISRPGVACPTTETSNNDTIVVRRVGNQATSIAPDTSRFNGVDVYWTVAACAGAASCIYQQSVRSVTVGKPFYLIAHRTNGLSEIRQALQLGANALELDIRFDRSNDRFCVNHDTIWFCNRDDLEPLLERLAAIARGHPRLALIIFDIKNDGGDPRAGEKLLELVRRKLTAVVPVPVLLSVANENSADILARLGHASGGLRPREGVAIDEENDPDRVTAFFRDAGLANHAFGNGTCSGCPVSPNIERSIRRAVYLKRASGEPRLVYVWTLAAETSMRAYLTRGVDGIMVNSNRIRTVKQVLDDFSRTTGLARRADNPFP